MCQHEFEYICEGWLVDGYQLSLSLDPLSQKSDHSSEWLSTVLVSSKTSQQLQNPCVSSQSKTTPGSGQLQKDRRLTLSKVLVQKKACRHSQSFQTSSWLGFLFCPPFHSLCIYTLLTRYQGTQGNSIIMHSSNVHFCLFVAFSQINQTSQTNL